LQVDRAYFPGMQQSHRNTWKLKAFRKQKAVSKRNTASYVVFSLEKDKKGRRSEEKEGAGSERAKSGECEAEMGSSESSDEYKIEEGKDLRDRIRGNKGRTAPARSET